MGFVNDRIRLFSEGSWWESLWLAQYNWRSFFAHRVSKHTSIKFSSFFFTYNREPTLLIDVKYSLVGIEGNKSEHYFDPFDKETFDPVLTTVIFMRANVHQTVGENISSAQQN